jgi:hypothetical protein
MIGPMIGPTTEPATEPATEPTTEPATEPTTEPTTERKRRTRIVERIESVNVNVTETVAREPLKAKVDHKFLISDPKKWPKRKRAIKSLERHPVDPTLVVTVHPTQVVLVLIMNANCRAHNLMCPVLAHELQGQGKMNEPRILCFYYG